MIDLKIITVSDNKFTPSSDGFAAFSGREALAQRIVKLLLTAKGSDFFAPTQGSTLLSLYGVYTEKSLNSVKMALPIIIQDFVNTIKQEQSSDQMQGIQYDDSDLLEDIIINSISFDKAYSGWVIELEIINKAHDTVRIVVP
jgi:hypothetical protein